MRIINCTIQQFGCRVCIKHTVHLVAIPSCSMVYLQSTQQVEWAGMCRKMNLYTGKCYCRYLKLLWQHEGDNNYSKPITDYNMFKWLDIQSFDTWNKHKFNVWICNLLSYYWRKQNWKINCGVVTIMILKYLFSIPLS